MKRKKDKFDLLMDEIYAFADKVIGTLNRIYVSHFNKLNSISYQELNVIESVKEVYEVVDNKTREYYLLLAKKVYKAICEYYDFELVMDFLTMDWVIKELERYDPVTKYVYIHEVDRKEARLVEAIIASTNKQAEIESGKKAWAKQARQYADNIILEAILKAYEDNDVKRLMWVTEEDEKVCPVCEGLEGTIYDFDRYPPAPHYGCRCYPKAVE